MTTKRVFSILLCIAITFGMTVLGGCQKSSETAPTSKAFAKENANIKFIRPDQNTTNKSDPYIMAINAYEKKYNAKVQIVTSDYNSWTSKLLASIASGDPIDVVFGDTLFYPSFAIQGYTQPLNDYCDLKSGYYNLDAMKTYFSYQDKYYLGCSNKSSYPCVIWYNKDMFDEVGVVDPLTLYKEGKWNWDTFKEVSKKFIRTTDSKQDRWGFDSMYPYTFLSMNKTSALKLDKQSKFSLNFDDPALITALDYIKDAWNTGKWEGLSGGDVYNSFYTGHDAMLSDYTWSAVTIEKAKKQGLFNFEYAAVPMPYGPNNKDNLNDVHSDGVSIVSGSKSPYHAGKLVDLVAKSVVDSVTKDQKSLPPDDVKLFTELVKKPFASRYYDSPVNGAEDLIAKATGDVDANTAINQVKPVYQQAIDQANKPPVKKIIRAFKTISVNFDKDVNGFAVYDTQAPNVSVKQITGADAIKGGSLEINMNTKDYGEWCDAAISDATKTPIYGYHKYKISFDYKVKDIPQPGTTEYTLRMHTKEGMSFDPLTFSPKIANTVEHFEGLYPLFSDNSASIGLEISGHFADTIIIDNLTITEVK